MKERAGPVVVFVSLLFIFTTHPLCPLLPPAHNPHCNLLTYVVRFTLAALPAPLGRRYYGLQLE